MFDLLQKTFLMSQPVLCRTEQAHRSDSCNWWMSVAILFAMMALLSVLTLGAPIA